MSDDNVSPKSKIFSFIEGQGNIPAHETIRGRKMTALLRAPQRSNLAKLGVPKKTIKRIIEGK